MKEKREKSVAATVEIPAKYAGKWIAWSNDHAEIVGSGDSISEARHEAIKNGETQAWLDKVPDRKIRFGGAAFRA